MQQHPSSPKQQYPQFQQPPQQQPNYTQPQTFFPPQQQWSQPPMPSQHWNPQPPPQQYQQPPQNQPPVPPRKKKARTRLWLILLAIVFVLAIIMVLASKGQTQQPTSTTHATQQPTTQLPARITSQVSIQSQVQSIVQRSGTSYVGGATITYDASAKYAHVLENIQVTGNNNLDVSRIKHDAFAIQKAIWQAHVSGVDALQIIFNSGDANRIATCELERMTAAKLNWASITRDQAWSDYDTTWLSKSL